MRNVVIALGNTGDPRAVPALITALEDPEPLVRGAVAWALGQLGGEDATGVLSRRHGVEADDVVRGEIERGLTSIHQRTKNEPVLRPR